jgi:hypothetical protein
MACRIDAVPTARRGAGGLREFRVLALRPEYPLGYLADPVFMIP